MFNRLWNIYHFPFHLPDFPLNRRHFLSQHQFHLDYRQVKFLRHYDFRFILNKLLNSMMHSIDNQLLMGYPHFPHENPLYLIHLVHQKIEDSRLILKKQLILRSPPWFGKICWIWGCIRLRIIISWWIPLGIISSWWIILTFNRVSFRNVLIVFNVSLYIFNFFFFFYFLRWV